MDTGPLTHPWQWDGRPNSQKTATKRQSVDIDTGVDLKDSHAAVKKYIDKKWQEQWNMSTKGRHLHKIQPSVSRHIPHHSKNRHQVTTAARLRLGKCQLNAYLHVIGRHSTGLCRSCSVPETIEHHLVECHNATKYKLQQLCKEADLLFTMKTILSRSPLLHVHYAGTVYMTNWNQHHTAVWANIVANHHSRGSDSKQRWTWTSCVFSCHVETWSRPNRNVVFIMVRRRDSWDLWLRCSWSDEAPVARRIVLLGLFLCCACRSRLTVT